MHWHRGTLFLCPYVSCACSFAAVGERYLCVTGRKACFGGRVGLGCMCASFAWNFKRYPAVGGGAPGFVKFIRHCFFLAVKS